MSKYVDVIVVGLGAMGAATAYQLAKKGKQVMGFDLYQPPHSNGSTHGDSRITRQAYYENEVYIPMLKRSYELWDQIEQDTATNLFTQTGGLMISEEGSGIAHKSHVNAQKFDIPHEMLGYAQLRRRYPQFRVDNLDTVALLDKTAGILNPDACLEAQLKLATQAGADLRFGEEMLEWSAFAQTEGVSIKTRNGMYFADQLVLCLGPWATELADSLGVSLIIDRIVQFYMQPKSGIQSYLPEQFPLFLWEEDNLGFYGIPALNGPNGGVKVSFYPYGPHKVRRTCTPENIDREPDHQDEYQIREYLQKYLPDLDHKVVRTSTCMHTNTPDYHPVIGAHTHHSQVSVAFGFSGHGFKFSNVVGECLADKIISGKSSFDLSMFAPDRFVWEE